MRAALTPRYFYESFAGADELVAATYDEVIAELAERGLAAFGSEGGTRDRITRAVSALIDVIDSTDDEAALFWIRSAVR